MEGKKNSQNATHAICHNLCCFCCQFTCVAVVVVFLLQHIHIQYSLTYRLSVLYPVAVVPLVVPEPEGGEDVVSRFSYRGDGGETPHGVISALHRQEVNWTVARTEKARKRDERKRDGSFSKGLSPSYGSALV